MAVTISSIGFPPDYSGKTDFLYNRSFELPVIKLTPLEYELNTNALGTWRFIKSRNAFERYKNICNKLGVNIASHNYLKIYALMEGSISDGINNSYGSSFLGSTLSAYGNSTIPEMLRLSNVGVGDVKKFISNLFGKASTPTPIHGADVQSEMLANNPGITENIKTMLNGLKNNSIVQKAVNGGFINGLVGLILGLKTDIPNIWQGSSANMSYSFTIRLYNPDPYNETLFQKTILAPMKALYALASPRSLDGIFYNRPFGVRIDVPGMYYIKEGAITSLSVVKGGDQSDFHYNQRPSSVDIRMSVESIYPTMSLMVDEEDIGSDTFKSASKAIAKSTKDKVTEQVNVSQSMHRNVTKGGLTGPPTINEYLKNIEDSYDYSKDINKNISNNSKQFNIPLNTNSNNTSSRSIPNSKRVLYDNLKC